MFSVPFQHVNNDGKGLMLNSDLKIANPSMGDDQAKADQIWVWVPANNGYDMFYFYDGEYGTGWCELQSGNEEFFEDDPVYGVTGIPEGAAMYYKAKSGAGKTATGSGQVEAESEYQVDLASGNYTMLANPYPSSLFLNNKDQVEYANPSMGDDQAKADQIWVWVPENNGYDMFYFYDGEYGTGGCELQSGNEEFFEDDPVYGVTGIPSGAAMYYKAKAGAGKAMIFKSPLK